MFARVIASTLWGYQKFKDLTKILMIEAVGLNPRFEEKYAELMRKSVSDIESNFEPKKEQGLIYAPDIKVAATAYIGAIHNVITCWIRDNTNSDLCDSSFPLVTFLLQAIKLEFNAIEIKQSIDEILEELESKPELLDIFRS